MHRFLCIGQRSAQYGIKWLEVTSMNEAPKIDSARHVMLLNPLPGAPKSTLVPWFTQLTVFAIAGDSHFD